MRLQNTFLERKMLVKMMNDQTNDCTLFARDDFDCNCGSDMFSCDCNL